ncbi:hypothetical protein PC116_g10446 [Phytophthora cactorum]|uniref:Uncharacterized protein n=1 Tax=Phytophthora cactorum TaxID=29920 RepID=A0A8T1DW41_9STRA|nr:hypothetical protein Pcac1_g13784 [Phytophthora cactorum]KAG2909941.1 hypothetical protein PC114_g9914 [Phytophthora cactorum]KAG2943691.1 hypothetical protein PC117_g9360 [Phytophthora cactorum]KAG2990603.1 hypothetical protein PC120_g22898 [Phytophthora cactorum]KAG3028080.1 hypothetical protein PC119_g7168 [Phytophthora cactorum]
MRVATLVPMQVFPQRTTPPDVLDYNNIKFRSLADAHFV